MNLKKKLMQDISELSDAVLLQIHQATGREMRVRSLTNKKPKQDQGRKESPRVEPVMR